MFSKYMVVFAGIITFELKPISEKEYNRMLKFVLSTYGVGLLIWVIVVMFINVNFS